MLTSTQAHIRTHFRTDYATSVSVTKNSAYASGNVLGGLITIDNSGSGPGPIEENPLSAILQSLVVLDPDSQNSAMDLFFFGTAPVAAMTNKTAFAPSLADLQNCLGVVQVVAGDYASGGANGSVAGTAKQTLIGRILKPNAPKATALYCVPVLRGTPTYQNGSVFFRFQFGQNAG